MNNKKLISRTNIHRLILNYFEPYFEELISRGGKISYSTVPLGFEIYMREANEKLGHKLLIAFTGEFWSIASVDGDDIYTYIMIYPNEVTFMKDATFEAFDRSFMYKLYETLKSYVEGDNKDNESISESTTLPSKEDIYNIISQTEILYYIISEHIEPVLRKCEDEPLNHYSPTSFWWVLDHCRYGIGCKRIDNHWEIYTGFDDSWEIYTDFDDSHVNIKIYPNNVVEFIDESAFPDFDKEFMYSLYMKIKEVLGSV